MKVLHIGAGNLFGGIETFLISLAKHRDLCAEMQPSFGLCFEGRFAEALRAAGVTVHMLGEMRASRPWTILKTRASLRLLLRGEHFDAVIFHGNWSYALLGGVAKKSGRKVILWFHGQMSGQCWEDRWAARIRPDAIISNSKFSAIGVERFFPGVPCDVVHCCVDAPSIENPSAVRKSRRDALGAKADDVVVFMFSRMEPLKGHRILLAALATLTALSNWTCWIAGGPQRVSEPQYFLDLIQMADALKLRGRVYFLNQRNDVRELLESADIVCQPNSGPESFGLSFVEAMYAGKTVVTSAIGGALEIVDSTCGILVPPNDIGALAEALKKLILDAGLRNALGRNGPARAKELCDPETVLKRLYEVVSGMVKSA